MAAKEAAKAKEAPKKAEKKPVKKEEKAVYSPWKVLMYPHLAEKSMNMVELENKLVFVVNRKANRAQIKEAVEKGFKVKVVSVNMLITQKGVKKAYVKLSPKDMASDIASRMGMI